MKLVVFGASGRTGKPLVEQALNAGHEVVAFVRSPEKMTQQHENLTIVKGDAMNAADVDGAIAGADAVLSTLGHTKTTPDNMQTIATEHIVTAMKKQGVRRLISLTGAGLEAPQDKPQLINHIIKLALITFAGRILEDARRHAAVIQQSDLDWVIVRGPMLTEGPYTGNYRVGWVGINTGPRISRADVADFMLKQLTDDTYLHQMPMISD